MGVDDGLLQTKPQVEADLAAITTNNFATAADIQAVQDTIDSLTTTLNATLAILEINDDDAFDTLAALQRQQAEVQRQIDGIETEQRQQRLDEVNDLREQAAGPSASSRSGSRLSEHHAIPDREPDPEPTAGARLGPQPLLQPGPSHPASFEIAARPVK